MARFYANENFPLPVVQELRRLGHDVLTIQETGRAGQAVPDEQVLSLAEAEGRILLTLNRKHFVRLHCTHPDHAGVVLCTFDPDFAGQAGRIHEAMKSLPHVAGQLLRINRPAA
jgi:predicted nuclease of predicted toxin-antitoxin system